MLICRLYQGKVGPLPLLRHITGLVGRALMLMTILVLAPHTAHARDDRYASIVVDADNGNVLYAVNPDRRSYPASLTKVMTLYLLFDALEQGKLTLNSRMPVSAHATRQSPSKLNLKVGDRIDVEDAVLSLVTKSANDVAVVVAEAIGGSEDDFAEMMTRKARQLGMSSTTYRNASGLPDMGQISTPRDQATLARALVKHHGRYYHYFSTRQFNWQGQPISTHNRLMLRYQGADGIKTGYINASGFNLIASAKRDGKRIVGVVFGGNTAGWRDNNMAQILDKGFARLGRGTEMRSAAIEEEDRADLDKLIASAASEPTNKGSNTARASFKAPAADQDVGDADPDSWGIQVGAFGDYKTSHKAASTAAKKLGALVSVATVDVAKAKSGKQVVYRSRLTGFTEDQARAACKRLTKAKQACKVVQPTA
uniref:D-alanyl-D-alanine carboxypeptidase n=1 Tax=Magnetospirillum gryphiswaldense TaxID=55518 RepID=A4TW86_9PROT|nr:D-alanyl-D-alanine carboxypeptidase [Magnetospirillum gryphiswaldense MSR-1]